MRTRIVRFGLVVPILVVTYFLIREFTEKYRTSPPEYQELIFAVGLSFIGIFLHFFKNHSIVKGKENYPIIKKRKNYIMTIDSLELLMLVVAPTFVSFKILKMEFPEHPMLMIIITLLAIGGWYIATLYRTSKKEDLDEGKEAFSFSSLLYGSIIAIVILGVWLILLTAQ